MKWYYSDDGSQKGPVSEDDLRSKLSSGEVGQEDLAWKDGMSGWVRISEISELTSLPPGSGDGSGAGASSPEAQDASPYQPPKASPQVPPVGGFAFGVPPQGSGKATASMVLGICSLVFACIPCLGLILGILALVFGRQVVEISKTRPELAPYVGRAIAGKVMGIIAVVIGVLSMIAGLVTEFSTMGS